MPSSNAEEAEIERLCEDLQDLLELTPKTDVLFTIWEWTAKVGSQEIPRVTSKFVLGVENEAGQRLTEFCQEKQNKTPRSNPHPPAKCEANLFTSDQASFPLCGKSLRIE